MGMNQTINLRNKAVKDISFMTKLMKRENFADIKVLDMSGNSLDDEGAKVIAEMLTDPNSTITKLDISKNKLTQVGL